MTSAHTTDLRRPRRATNGRPASRAALVVAILVILAAAPQAQQSAPAFVASAPPPTTMLTGAPTDVDLLVGRSTVLNVGSAIARVSLTVPDIADAMVTAPGQLLIHGKQPGTISLFVWDRAGAIKTFEVRVRRDLTPLIEHLKQLFPSENITVMGSGKDVVVSGMVSSKYVIEKAAEVAGGYVEKKENVVNLLQQQEGIASNQVMLRVRFAEVSRSALTELGASWFTGANGFHDYVARATTQQFPAPEFNPFTRESMQGVDKWGGGRDTVTATGGKMEFSDFLNLFIFNNRYSIGTVVRALQERGLFQSLAEPNLVATNGKEASFLAGGEFPIPVVQSGQAGNAISIIFKEFGVRLHFTPTVLGGDLINLKVKPEVSSLDFNNAVVLDGFRIPALTTRRTETEVELQDGQTFAIAGLMNNTVLDSIRKIPGIGDIPILGWLFKSKAMQKAQTELVVMITPHIVRKGQPGVSEGIPSLVEPYLGAPNRRLPNPDAYIGSPRYPVNQSAPRPAPASNEPPPPPPPSAEAGALQAAPATGPDAQAPSPAANELGLPSVNPPDPPAPDVPQARENGAGQAAPPRMTKEQQRAVERAREEERKAAEKAAREARKNEELRKQAEKLELERRKRDAEATKKGEEQARKQGDDEQRRQRALADAAIRLKQAQEAYQAELSKTSGSKGGQQ